MRWTCARALYFNPDATLDDLREAESMLKEVARIARRVLGGAHPLTLAFEQDLQNARADLRAALDARETPPRSA